MSTKKRESVQSMAQEWLPESRQFRRFPGTFPGGYAKDIQSHLVALGDFVPAGKHWFGDLRLPYGEEEYEELGRRMNTAYAGLAAQPKSVT